MYNLINEFGLKREGFKLTYKDYTVATIDTNTSVINQVTGKNAYRLCFTGFFETVSYEISKKYTEKRIKMIKEIIIHNKKVEIEKDFKE